MLEKLIIIKNSDQQMILQQKLHPNFLSEVVV